MKKLLPIAIITLLAVAGIAWFVSGKFLPQVPSIVNLPTPGVKTGQVQVKLSLVPETTTLRVGEQGVVNVVVDTGGLGLSGVESNLDYDPEYINVIEVVAGPFLTDPASLVEKIDPANGLISYTLASLKYSQGQGIVYNILVEALKPTSSASLKFDRQLTKTGLKSMTEDKRYAEDEVSVEFSEQSFSILP